MKPKSKIGILGVGAIGTVISYELQKSDSHVLFYYNRTKKDCLKLISENSECEIPINIETSITGSPKLDWLIICLKEHQYSKAKYWFKKLISPKTQIAVIRNGINLKAPLLDFAAEKNILECMIDCPIQLQNEGSYKVIRKPILTVNKSPIANNFKLLFDAQSIEVNQTKDFKTANWRKLCESATLGAILCLSGETCWVFQDKKMRDLYRNIITEAVLVAQADGAKIESSFINEMLIKLMTYPDTKSSSMLIDRLNGNPIELGAKNGVISDLGKHYNVNTPMNDLIVSLLSKTNREDKA